MIGTMIKIWNGVKVRDCSHIVFENGQHGDWEYSVLFPELECPSCRRGVTITDIYLYKYARGASHIRDDGTPWLIGTSGRGMFGAIFLREATKEDIKKIRKMSDWVD